MLSQSHNVRGRDVRAMAVGERVSRVGSPTFPRLSLVGSDAAPVPVLLVLPHPHFRSYWFSHNPSSGPIGSPTTPIPVLLVLPHPHFRSGWFSYSPVAVLLVLPHPQLRFYRFSHVRNSGLIDFLTSPFPVRLVLLRPSSDPIGSPTSPAPVL